MSIAALEVVKDLRKTYLRRGLRSHAATSRVLLHDAGSKRIFIVLDPDLSRRTLKSDTLRNDNYFAPNLEQLARKGRALPHIQRYFDHAPLFKEGDEHRQLRSRLNPLIQTSCDILRAQADVIVQRACRRLDRCPSPLELARYVVRLSFTLAICSVVPARAGNVLRAIRLRGNVFQFHFHPEQHRRMDAALERLSRDRPSHLGEADAIAWNYAESLLVMGIDPCVAAITAAIVERHPGRFSDAIYRYHPTSFISRTCTQPMPIGEHQAGPGDLLYLSILPGADAPQHDDATSLRRSAIPFGAGPHLCIGHPVASLVCDLGERVHRELSGPMASTPALEPRGDGAFLAF